MYLEYLASYPKEYLDDLLKSGLIKVTPKKENVKMIGISLRGNPDKYTFEIEAITKDSFTSSLIWRILKKGELRPSTLRNFLDINSRLSYLRTYKFSINMSYDEIKKHFNKYRIELKVMTLESSTSDIFTHCEEERVKDLEKWNVRYYKSESVNTAYLSGYWYQAYRIILSRIPGDTIEERIEIMEEALSELIKDNWREENERRENS